MDDKRDRRSQRRSRSRSSSKRQRSFYSPNSRNRSRSRSSSKRQRFFCRSISRNRSRSRSSSKRQRSFYSPNSRNRSRSKVRGYSSFSSRSRSRSSTRQSKKRMEDTNSVENDKFTKGKSRKERSSIPHDSLNKRKTSRIVPNVAIFSSIMTQTALSRDKMDRVERLAATKKLNELDSTLLYTFKKV